MDLKNIQLTDENLSLASSEEITLLEKQVGVGLPQDYAEFVTRLGVGILNDTIRVYGPNRIRQEYKEFQDRWREYYFWDEGRDILTKERVLESIVIADTANGDEVIFHPSDNKKLYLLPRDSETIFVIGSSLGEAITWMLSWDELFSEEDEAEEEKPAGIYFEPFSEE